MEGSLKVSSSLSYNSKIEISKLIYNSLPIFYDLLPVPEEERNNLIASQLKLKGMEIFHTKAFLKENKVLGVYTAFPSKKLKTLQMGSSMAFLKNLPLRYKNKYLKSLKEYSAKVGEVPENCYYLSRIAVAELEQGSGLASFLLKQFFLDGNDFNLFGLHVHKKNSKAIRFFHKNGFQKLDCPDKAFYIMTRSLTKR